MNLQRIGAIVRKNLINIIKEPASLFMIILFPIILTFAFGISFGKVGGGGDQTYTLAVVNYSANQSHPEWGVNFIGNLSANEMLEVTNYMDKKTAEIDLQEGKISGVVIIPTNFGESIQSYTENMGNSSAWVNTSIELYLDSGSMIASQVVKPLVQEAIVKTIYGEDATKSSGPVSIGTPTLVEAKKLTMFDYMAPGLFAFSAIFLIMIVSQTLTEQKEKGLLKRIQLTPITPTEMMMGETMSNMIAAILQATLIFLVGYAIGFRPELTIGAFLMAFLLIVVFSLCCVGFGLITGAVSKNSGMATGLSFVFILPQMFLGTYITLGEPTLANQFVPAFYVTEALKSLFLRGASPLSAMVLSNLLIGSLFSIGVFILGIFAFQKYAKN